MKKNIFITGIGTNVGKTIVSSILVESLEADYWKPIQAGDLHNSDSMKVQRLITNTKSKFHTESYKLQEAASPHYAAELENVQIEIDKIKRPKTNNNLIIEGAGGLLVPINSTNFISDLIQPHDYVILVSKHELGSINHTLLSLQYLKKVDCKKVGLIFIGDENNATEKIILHFSKIEFHIGIPLIKSFSKDTIKIISNNISNKLQEFLK